MQIFHNLMLKNKVGAEMVNDYLHNSFIPLALRPTT